MNANDLDGIEARILFEVDAAFAAARSDPVPGPELLAAEEVFA